MTAAEQTWTKADAWAAFRDAAKGLWLDQSGLVQGFDTAWEARGGEGAQPGRWVAWIRRAAHKARTHARDTEKPGGLFLTILAEGPDCDLREPERAVRDREAEQAAYFAEVRRAKEILPPERPSLLALFEARRAGGETAVKDYLRPFRAAEEEIRHA